MTALTNVLATSAAVVPAHVGLRIVMVGSALASVVTGDVACVVLLAVAPVVALLSADDEL